MNGALLSIGVRPAGCFLPQMFLIRVTFSVGISYDVTDTPPPSYFVDEICRGSVVSSLDVHAPAW